MEMTDKNVIYLLKLELILAHGNLSSLTAINQEKLVVQVHQLSRWVSLERWRCRSTAEYVYFKFQNKKTVRSADGYNSLFDKVLIY